MILALNPLPKGLQLWDMRSIHTVKVQYINVWVTTPQSNLNLVLLWAFKKEQKNNIKYVRYASEIASVQNLSFKNRCLHKKKTKISLWPSDA